MNPSPSDVARSSISFRGAVSLVLAPLGAVLLATGTRIWLEPYVRVLPAYFTFYLAVVLSAWYGGGVSGAIAWFAGLIVGHILNSLAGAPTPVAGSSFSVQAYFTTSSAITILLFELQRRARSKLEAYGMQLEIALDASKAANEDIVHLNAQLREAMRETHHRVKNNLQIITALIDLRVNEGVDIKPAELEELNRHVRALAAIHDVLTGAVAEEGSTDTLSAKQGIQRVVDLLSSVMPDKQIEAHIEDIRIPQRNAAALAIMVNELVNNAAKHGGSLVEVKLTKVGDTATVSVSDDGPGLRPDFSPADHGNTGLELVERLARWDLRGETEYGSNGHGGACVKVTFPIAA